MKILIISPTQSGIGGIAQHVQGLKKFLELHNHIVEIISSENTFTIPIKGLKNLSFMVSSFLKTKFQNNYDIVHVQNPISALAMKNVKAKKILSLQGEYSKQISFLHGNILGAFSQKLEKNSLKWADAITVPSKEMYDEYTKRGYKVFHVPNAINISSLSKEIDRRYDKQIIFAGRLSEEKGILDLLIISHTLPKDIHLIIIGSGPEESKIQNISTKYTNIHYLGFQSKENTIKLIRGSDVLIQPSIMEGGTSTTLLESMACKIPIITTPVGGNKEILIHMKTAYIVKPNNPSELIDAIEYMFSNPDKAKLFSDNAFEIVKNYDWEHIIHNFISIYQKVLA